MDVQTLLEKRRIERDTRRLILRIEQMRAENDLTRENPEPEPDENADWILRLRPIRNGFGSPPICRMRRLLKAALRQHGFRAIEHRQVSDGGEKKAAG